METYQTLANRKKDASLAALQQLQREYHALAKQARVLLPDGTDAGDEGRHVGKINSNYLQGVMVEAIEDFGGAAHPSTLAQYAMSVWARKDSDDDDAVSFEFQDYRKAVKAELKRNPEMFERVKGRGQFTEWKLTDEELVRRKRALSKWRESGFLQHHTYSTDEAIVKKAVPLPDFLRDLLDDRTSGMSLKQVDAAVLTQWVRQPVVVDGYFDSCQLAYMTLTTNPAFHDHDRDPSLWENAPPPSKPVAGRALLSRSINATSAGGPAGATPGGVLTSPLAGAHPASGIGAAAGGGNPAGTDETAFKRPERSRRRERSPSPTAESARDSAGASAANAAAASSASRPSLSARGKRKKEAAASSDAGQWIQCDRCKKWVSTLDDNITDLSLYDDNNPNHLEYFCPGCRDDEAQMDKRSSARLGKGSRPQYREAQPESEAEIAAMLDDLEKEMVSQYQTSRVYWRKQETAAAPFSKELVTQCTELEDHWKESIAHFKRRLVGREEDLEGARTTFEDFFKDQLMHLKESIGNKLKRDAIK